MSNRLRAGVTLGCVLITACGGGGNADDGDDGGPPEEEHPAGDIAGCGSDPLFTVHPVPLADLRAIGPLGFMNPPSHVFPNQHVGFTPPFDEPPVLREPTLSAPGDIRITEVHNISTEVDGNTFNDYSIFFFPCAEARFYFGHVASLSDELIAQLGPWEEDECDEDSSSTGGVIFRTCRKTVRIDMPAGSLLGTIGGPNQGSMDFGGSDTRVTLDWISPERLDPDSPWGPVHYVCALDYFEPTLRDELLALIGTEMGPRVGEPLCGESMQDVQGSAQGRWYFSEMTYPEDPHLALARHPYDTGRGVVSIGTSVPGVPYGDFDFVPNQSGR
ncbi:MAG: hypothetical protein KJN97_07555, partial [Deltaproteobacteria bacterium]|nr:hypothetical protein [Deltaproteobacteria bacterium]